MEIDKVNLTKMIQDLGADLLGDAESEAVKMFRRITDFRQTITSESDRGCALMAAAYIDECLGELLRSYFVDDAKEVSKLFEFNGACGTFSSKIALAYALGLISKNVRSDLTLLRRIRNDFAHVSKPICFDENPIRSRCHELKLYPHPKEVPPRLRFCRSMMIAVTQIEATRADLEKCSVKEDYNGEHSAKLAQAFTTKLDEALGTDLAQRV
ncbi:MltR family transcriptional regulator [Vibrio vulnificus]|nr:MltR family transcriptional regulator [Vibrio vulnificus]